MERVALVFGLLCLALAVVILLFADGLRRWYSGIFFAVIGTVTVLSALRSQRKTAE